MVKCLGFGFCYPGCLKIPVMWLWESCLTFLFFTLFVNKIGNILASFSQGYWEIYNYSDCLICCCYELQGKKEAFLSNFILQHVSLSTPPPLCNLIQSQAQFIVSCLHRCLRPLLFLSKIGSELVSSSHWHFSF